MRLRGPFAATVDVPGPAGDRLRDAGELAVTEPIGSGLVFTPYQLVDARLEAGAIAGAPIPLDERVRGDADVLEVRAVPAEGSDVGVDLTRRARGPHEFTQRGEKLAELPFATVAPPLEVGVKRVVGEPAGVRGISTDEDAQRPPARTRAARRPARDRGAPSDQAPK